MGSHNVLRQSAAGIAAAIRGEEPVAPGVAAVVDALVAEGLGEVQVLTQMRLPLTDKQTDLVLVGTHPRDGGISVVLVETKKWSAATPHPDGSPMVIADGKVTLHPANQVWAYCSQLHHFSPALDDRADFVFGLVYLPKMDAADLAAVDPFVQRLDRDVLLNVRMFGNDQLSQLRAFLRTVLSGQSASAQADALLTTPTRPSQALMKVAADEVLHRSIFTLVDEQRAAYDQVVYAAQNRSRGVKEVFIITGGTRTGKSTLALELLGALNRLGVRTVHATGSRAFTSTLRTLAGRGSSRAKQLFMYFNSFSHAEPNSVDVLLADEAHRIRESSNHRFTARDKRSAVSQVEELLDAARVPVFLLDERQVLRRGEVGTVEMICKAAAAKGLNVTEVALTQRFGGGGENYDQWLEQLLGLTSGGPRQWEDNNYTLRLAETPRDMEVYLQAHIDQGYTARMAAGYCWRWNNARPDGSLINDVAIGDWARPWNAKPEQASREHATVDSWNYHPHGFEQIGSIYTAQGFEYDYAGVIIGPDLTWTPSGWTSTPGASHDAMVRTDKNFDQLVRLTYKILCTRGNLGTVIYSVDPATRDMLASLGIRRV